ncbi:Hypothetical protein GbCGDNIH9_8718 [Granulibacter bethesdensis]|uniref:Uncharacterized protein n=1 Tax=Granulibacter bethesdensis TaxID=364410 RepID=A0AAC9K9Y2_9PROT|nr:Hypothetical protein GbCGDNIH9_8718 [Granulibacter bethesdensis]APH61929.1 Hypothetical protein GbCGDNIH8_8718 [Granulibacter bethesdensis]
MERASCDRATGQCRYVLLADIIVWIFRIKPFNLTEPVRLNEQ